MINRAETFSEALRRLMNERSHTFRTLGAVANMSKSKLGSMCRPGAAVADEDAIALDAVLDSGLTLVSAARRDRQLAVTAVLLGRNRYTDLAVSLSGEFAGQGVSAVDRRGVLQAGLLVPAVVLELSRLGLGDAMASRGAVSAAEWEEIVTEHGFAYMTTPPEEMLEQLMVDVLAIQYAADGEPADSRRARNLQRCAALLAALTAMTVANLGQLREGRRWWRTARSLADKSADSATQAWVYGREIVRALYENRPIGAIIRMIDSFEANLPEAPQNSMLEFVTGKAQSLALAGRRNEAEACLPRLMKICDELPSSLIADGDSIFGWSLDRLKFTESYVYSFIGEYPKAAEAQAAAIELYAPTYARGPAQIELQRSICLAKIGDSTQAATHAKSVIDSLHPGDRIRPVVDLGFRVLTAISQNDQNRPEVRDYKEFLGFAIEIEA
jgi:tetratricopeptide (TPR) repeat protein